MKRADRLKPNSRLDDLINILEEIIDTVYSRKGVTRQLNLPNVEKSVAFKRYELFHPKDKSVYDNYDIRIVSDVKFRFVNKKTKNVHWVEIMPDDMMPCHTESCAIECSQTRSLLEFAF